MFRMKLTHGPFFNQDYWTQRKIPLTYMNEERIKKALESWPSSDKPIFVNSFGDNFHESIAFETIARWHSEFFMSHREHRFALLTKRIGRAMLFYRQHPELLTRNIWIGTSIGIRKTLFRLDQIRRIPAAVRFISFEPLLEDLGLHYSLAGIHWVLVGGESSRRANHLREMKPEWAENIKTIAQRCGTAFFFKQMGGYGGDGAGGDKLNGVQYKTLPKAERGESRPQITLDQFAVI